jgi:transposase
MGVVKRIDLAAAERAELERIVGAASSEVRMVERARIVLCAAEGLKGSEVADRVGCSLPTVVKWRGRYARAGIEGLRDAPRPGPALTHGPEVRALLIAKACTRPPATPEGARQERWTYEQLGAAVGMSGSQAHAILARAEIKPHLTDYWIMSDFSQPEFEERCAEICGCTSTRPQTCWSSRSTRRPPSRPRPRPSPTPRPRPGARRGASTSTSATARSACSPR